MSPIFGPLKGDFCYKTKGLIFKGGPPYKLLLGKKVRVKETPFKVFLNSYIFFPSLFCLIKIGKMN